MLRLCGGLLLACLIVSTATAAALLWDCEPKAFARGMIAAVILPLLLGIPILAFLAGRILALSAQKRALESHAYRDGLTQLLNRSTFTQVVQDKLIEMERLSTARGALLIADADHFKTINDRWGHAVGDEALQRIAKALESVLHRDDAIGRLGGEEFGIFLYGSGAEAARAVAERLRAQVEAIELRLENGEHVAITVSLGAIHFGMPLAFASLYNMADRNLYAAKANGRNRVVFEKVSLEAYGEQAA